MTPELTDISHSRAPYKDAYFGGFGDAASDALALVSTVTPGGVRVLAPAGALALVPFLQAFGYAVLTTAADKEQILVQPTPGAAGQAVMDWVDAQLAKGRSVMISTNAPTGVAGLLTTGSGVPAVAGQVVLASVSTQADELAGAGANTGAALLQPSKLTPAGVPALAAVGGMAGPIGIAVLALVVVGGVYYVFGRKKTAHPYGR
jgi:hypothetical protein